MASKWKQTKAAFEMINPYINYYKELIIANVLRVSLLYLLAQSVKEIFKTWRKDWIIAKPNAPHNIT